MSDISSIAATIQPVVGTISAQRVNEGFTRQASQISALLTTAPTTTPDSARSVNPTSVAKGYTRNGEIEKEEAPTGEHFSIAA